MISEEELPIHHFDAVADGLAENGFAVIDDFLCEEEAAQLLEVLDWHQDEGRMRRAGIGTAHQYQVEKSIRGDLIRWIDPNNAAAPTQLFIDRMRELLKYINRTCFLGLRDIESHFTIYPIGTFYKRHLDQLRDNDHRRLTFICYLNFNWQPEFGGQLRMYLPKGEGEEAMDIQPTAGKLVVFRSEMIEHEVLTTDRERCSVTGWMLDTPPGLTFL